MEKGKTLLTTKHLVLVDFLDNILEANSKSASPIDLSELEFKTYTLGSDSTNWRVLLILIVKLFKGLLSDFLSIREDLSIQEYLNILQQKMSHYIRPAFFNMLYMIGDMNNSISLITRYEIEELYMYFRIAIERIEICKTILNTPEEKRKVFLHVRDREKTVLCRNINRGGCPREKNCKFAHSIEEQQLNAPKLDKKLKEIEDYKNKLISAEEEGGLEAR